jgi:hypothetical protein
MTNAILTPIRILILAGTLGCGLTLSPLFAATKQVPSAQAAGSVAQIPERRLTCSVRHVTNFDPNKEQTAAELRYDAVHPLTLVLPSIAVRTKAPPEPQDDPEPVDARTRIILDPGHIAPTKRGKFERVIDYWPDRTELSATISGDLLNVIVINNYDPANKTANFFMTRATELTRFQANHVYQGECKVLIGASATDHPVA